MAYESRLTERSLGEHKGLNTINREIEQDKSPDDLHEETAADVNV